MNSQILCNWKLQLMSVGNVLWSAENEAALYNTWWRSNKHYKQTPNVNVSIHPHATGRITLLLSHKDVLWKMHSYYCLRKSREDINFTVFGVMLERTKVNNSWFRCRVIKLKQNVKYLLYWDCNYNLWDDPQLSLNSLNILLNAAFYMYKALQRRSAFASLYLSNFCKLS